MSKKIIIKENGLVLIKGGDLSIVMNNEEDLQIDDFDFAEDAKDIFLLNNELLYNSEKSLFKMDLETGEASKVMELEDKKMTVFDDKIYLASFIDASIKIETYDDKFSLIKENLFAEFENTEVVFNTDYPIMVDLWDDDDEYENIKPIITGFTVEDGLFVISMNKDLYFGDFGKQVVKNIEIPQTYGMDVDLFLRKPALTLHGRDKEVSLDFTITQLPFRKKRRGGIEKLEVKLLKRGVDNITPSVSKNGEFWFGSEGEDELFPILVNLKKLEPLVVFDEAISNEHEMTASEDLKTLYITDFESELKKYDWNEEGIFLDYIVDLKE